MQRSQRRLLYAGLAAAPLLTAGAMAADPASTSGGIVVFVAVWTGVAWSALAVAAFALRRPRADGQIAFAFGLAMAVLALAMTWAGGVSIVPALCAIPVAASVRRGGGWYRGRLTAAVGALLAAWVVYAAALAS